MGTTASGLVYPDPTDPPDGPGQLQDLAESIDTLLAGGAWVTSTTGFTAATNFTLTSVRYRIIGNEVDLVIVMARATSTLTVAADGDISNINMLTAIPSTIIPAQTQPWEPYLSSSGRACAGVITSGGVVSLAWASPGSNIAVSDVISLHARYWKD